MNTLHRKNYRACRNVVFADGADEPYSRLTSQRKFVALDGRLRAQGMDSISITQLKRVRWFHVQQQNRRRPPLRKAILISDAQ